MCIGEWWKLIWPLLQLLHLKGEDPRTLLGPSMFLDISAVYGPIFLKPTLLSFVKEYTVSSLIISSLISRKIIKLLKHHLTTILNLPFNCPLFNARFQTINAVHVTQFSSISYELFFSLLIRNTQDKANTVSYVYSATEEKKGKCVSVNKNVKTSAHYAIRGRMSPGHD